MLTGTKIMWSRQQCEPSYWHFKMYIILIFLILIQTQAFSPDSVVVTQSNTTTTSSTPSLFTCKDLKTRTQRDLCYDTPGLLETLIKSEQLAKEECVFRFKDHKWKCFGFSMLTPNNVTKRASKETSFIYAIISATLTHTITEACQNEIMDCKSKTLTGSSKNNTHSVSADLHNVTFSVSLAEEFLDSAENTGKSFNARQRLNLHNNRLGRMVVQNNTRWKCRCDGLSASCSLTTCVTTLADLTTISAIIYEAYMSSCKVRTNINSDEPGFIAVSEDCKEITNDTMIHYDNSVDYCYRDLSVGSPGVKGEECDPHVTGSSSCSEFCCGRGYVEKQMRVESDCCSFVWCCRIECSPCIKDVNRYFCK